MTKFSFGAAAETVIRALGKVLGSLDAYYKQITNDFAVFDSYYSAKVSKDMFNDTQ